MREDYREISANKQANILLLTTGGTIGSALNSSGNIDVSPDSNAGLSSALVNALDIVKKENDIQIYTHEIASLLSENIIPADWNHMSNAIRLAYHRYTDKDINGIVITHGSDTLAYTAAALSFLLCPSPVPIVLTAAAKPPESPDSDAAGNLANSIRLASSKISPMVYVLFASAKYEAEIFLGTRIGSIASYQGYYSGVPKQPHGIVNNTTVYMHDEKNSGFSKVLNKVNDFPNGKRMSSQVKIMHMFPGIQARDMIGFTQEACVAVILVLYHSGTASTRDEKGEDYAIDDAIRYLTHKKISVFGLPLEKLWLGEAVYSTTEKLTNAGLIPLPPMSIEAAYGKISMLVSQSTETALIRKELAQNYVGEIMSDREIDPYNS